MQEEKRWIGRKNTDVPSALLPILPPIVRGIDQSVTNTIVQQSLPAESKLKIRETATDRMERLA